VKILYPNILVNKGYPCEAVNEIRLLAEKAQNSLQKKLLTVLNSSSSVRQREAFREYVKWGKRVEGEIAPYNHNNRNAPVDRKIKVGYVSNDFRSHSVAYFLEGIISNHDRDKFEVYCYCCNAKKDHVTERFCQLADHWCDISQIEESKERATLIYSHEVDILVDLGGHFTDDIDIFVYKPAPIQVSYLGFPNTTGLSRVD